MEWTDEVIERLKTLWAEGHSTAEIGRRLGTTKNAVVGKAHRLKLPTRPSPIKSRRKKQATASKDQNELFEKEAPAPKPLKEREPAKASLLKTEILKPVAKSVLAPKEERKPKPIEKPVLEKKVVAPKEPAPSVLDEDNFDDLMEEDFAAEAARLKAKRKSKPAEKREKLVPQVPKRLGLTCQWPFGDPGDADFHFCGGKIVPGRPYCLEHCEQAYVRKIVK
ncbi:GcrA cell cycle regulator [Acetobacteraceae bacterium]|nr:GcrA cell cycle regulator [Acetobacteraceae bacterium]